MIAIVKLEREKQRLALSLDVSATQAMPQQQPNKENKENKTLDHSPENKQITNKNR